jgi:hypothetical protein
MKFEELGLAPELVRAVTELGYDEPTPIQRMAIPLALEGKDVLGRAQTGTGKTAAFMLPIAAAAAIPPRTASRAGPLPDARAGDPGRGVGTRLRPVPGALPRRGLRRRSAPERDAGSARRLRRAGRDAGPADRPRGARQRRPLAGRGPGARRGGPHAGHGLPAADQRDPAAPAEERQTLFFSATMPNEVQVAGVRQPRDPSRWRPRRTRRRPRASSSGSTRWTGSQKTDLLVELLGRPGMDSVIVFTRTKIGADKVHTRLKSAGISVAVMHGDRDMKDRVRALDSFRDREGAGAGRDGRGAAGPRRRGHLPRRQLRHAAGPGQLRAPRRPHGARRAEGRGDHLHVARPRSATCARSRSTSAGEGQTAPEKMVSAMRSEFRSLAEARGLDPRVAEAMVDEDIAVEGVVRRASC